MYREIRSKGDMSALVREWGIAPFFKSNIPGFSIEDHTIGEVCAPGDTPWEWKGAVIRETGAVYGKFFRGKAGYVMPELFLDFANYRRSGYDLDARYEDGLTSRDDKVVYETLAANGPMLQGDLRKLCGFGKGRKEGFEPVITRLQMQGYIITTDFGYKIDKAGRPYGWGVATISTPEQYLGESFAENVYRRSPEESLRRLLDHLHNLLPDADEKALMKLITIKGVR